MDLTDTQRIERLEGLVVRMERSLSMLLSGRVDIGGQVALAQSAALPPAPPPPPAHPDRDAMPVTGKSELPAALAAACRELKESRAKGSTVALVSVGDLYALYERASG